MIDVADAGPLRYLILIECVDVLRPLYDRAVVSMSVARELRHSSAPPAVRNWMVQLPSWREIHADPLSVPGLGGLGLGERAAIELVSSMNVDLLLMDDRLGRIEAQRRHLAVAGALGILAAAHRHRLLDFDEALARLRQTNFYLAADLIDRVRRQLSGGDV